MSRPGEEDVRRGLQELGDPLAQEGNLQRVLGRARGYRRRRVGSISGAFAVVLISVVGLIALRGDPPTGAAPRDDDRAVAGADCVAINDGVPTFPQFSEDETPHGAAGDSIAVSGSGFFDPATRVEVVWNAGAPGVYNGPSEQSSRSYTAAEGELQFGCEFDLAFTVPDVPEGRYPVLVRVYDPSSMFSVSNELTFEVTG